jgi:DNA-binding transcriptional ArsR family regulator
MSDVAAELDQDDNDEDRDQPTTDETSGLDYPLADTVHAGTPERMKALGDRVRLTILDLVLERAMTVTELAERLGRPRGSVAHHVNVLVDAGLLQVVRVRRVRAVDERFYGRVARTIVFPGVPGELPFVRDAIADADYARMEAAEAAETGGANPDQFCGGGFTYRHARIPAARANEFAERLQELALEFVAEPRSGNVEYAMYVGVFPTTRRVAPPTEQPAEQTEEPS